LSPVHLLKVRNSQFTDLDFHSRMASKEAVELYIESPVAHGEPVPTEEETLDISSQLSNLLINNL